MKVRPYNNEYDYAMIRSWWEAHDILPFPASALKAVGYVSHDGEKDIAVAWLLMDYTCGVAWMNLFLSNPEATPKQIHQAHQDIAKCFEMFAKSEGFGLIMAFYDRRSLTKVAKRSGFEVNHESVSQMYKVLTPQLKEA